MRILLIIVLMLMLAGCASLGAKGVDFGLNTIDETTSFLGEIDQRREDVRLKQYEVEDARYQHHMTRYELLKSQGQWDEALKELKKAEAIIPEIYPTVTSVKQREKLFTED